MTFVTRYGVLESAENGVLTLTEDSGVKHTASVEVVIKDQGHAEATAGYMHRIGKRYSEMVKFRRAM